MVILFINFLIFLDYFDLLFDSVKSQNESGIKNTSNLTSVSVFSAQKTYPEKFCRIEMISWWFRLFLGYFDLLFESVTSQNGGRTSIYLKSDLTIGFLTQKILLVPILGARKSFLGDLLGI